MAIFSLEFDSEERNLFYKTERALILFILRAKRGNRVQTAKMLGCGIRTLQRKIKELEKAGECIPQPYNRSSEPYNRL